MLLVALRADRCLSRWCGLALPAALAVNAENGRQRKGACGAGAHLSDWLTADVVRRGVLQLPECGWCGSGGATLLVLPTGKVGEPWPWGALPQG
ncbi:hypothetical protein NDU88_001148 [Pleurodeles waltl]|uniref:Uncharacterized protein n=1 Tax=Pleurodeles waltl TaxID=8319 RepID=A0AAV7LBR9_PLEWA|nr:hypothetical protein NDU88_001148 [Pleurodeles waltl]